MVRTAPRVTVCTSGVGSTSHFVLGVVSTTAVRTKAQHIAFNLDGLIATVEALAPKVCVLSARNALLSSWILSLRP